MNKKIFLMVLIVCIGWKGFTQCVPLSFDPGNAQHVNTSTIMVLDIKDDFCALGDGVTNDQAAFDSASAFINSRGGYCRLVIPAGTYRIGRQFRNAKRYRTTQFGLLIRNVNKVEIAGDGNPVIQYDDGLMYGYFDTLTGAPMDIDASWNDSWTARVAADLGHILYFESSKNIKVTDLTLDGNLYPGKMVIGGRNVDNFLGIQELFSGICIWITDSVEITNVISRRMGLDGFLLWEGSNRSVQLENCHAEYNGRQGLSIVNGSDVVVNNSSFTNSGMGELIYTGLQGGVDLEPEDSLDVIKNIYFNNCTFADCRNAAVIVNAGMGRASDIYFNNCLIQNANEIGNSVALDIGRHKTIQFRDCNLYGYVTISSADSAKALGEGFSFLRCLFSDCYHRRVSTPSGCIMVREPMVLTSTALIYNYESNDQRYLVMDSCIFDTYTKRPWVSLSNDPTAPSTIRSSVVYVNGQTGTDIPNSALFSTIIQDDNIKLDNNKFYMHPDQCYLHGADTISGSTPTMSTNTWQNNTFYRWTIEAPKGVCADSIPCPELFQALSGQLGSMENVTLKVSVYPNPSEGLFTVNFGKKVANALVAVQSVDGRIIFKQRVEGTSTCLNLSGAPSGLYFIFVSEGRNQKVQKLTLR